MDSAYVKKQLSENSDLIVAILEQFGFESISDNYKRNEIRCAYEAGGNPSSVCVNTDTLQAVAFSKSIKGDIYTLLMEKSGKSFGEVHDILSAHFDEDDFDNRTVIKPLFGNVFKNLLTGAKPVIYPMSKLDQYESVANVRFYQDGISTTVQKMYGIRYCHERQAIVIPWFNEMHQLVGVKARINFESENGSRYYAIEEFSKTNYLYGIHVNREHIIERGVIIVAEAEKASMQGFSKGFKNVVSIGSHNLSETQSLMLRYYGYKRIILMFDHDVPEEELKKQCGKLRKKLLFCAEPPQIYYVCDRLGSVLTGKESPFDKSTEEIKELMKHHIYKYKE